MYPVISDRILRTRDYYCHFVPAENPQFVIALAFLGHHIPCIVILICYVIVFIEIRKLFKVRPGDKLAAAKAKARNNVEVATVSAATTMAPSSAVADPSAPGTSKDPDADRGDEGTEVADEQDMASKKTAEPVKDGTSTKTKQKNEAKSEQRRVPQKRQTTGAQHVTADAKARADRERKSFVTLSYIVIGYVICWVPFHFVYDVSFIRPELISDDLFTATFWLTYVNSTLNPFLYAFSSADLRTAVAQMLKCRCLRKW